MNPQDTTLEFGLYDVTARSEAPPSRRMQRIFAI